MIDLATAVTPIKAAKSLAEQANDRIHRQVQIQVQA